MSGREPPPGRTATARVVGRRVLHKGWLTLTDVTVETAVRGVPVRLSREVHDHGDGAAALAYDPRALTAVLVRQIRAGALLADGSGVTLEAIAGLVDRDEDPADTVRREAMEEAGLALGPLERIGAPYASPGALTERVHLFLAEIDGSVPRAAGGGAAEEHEEIEVVDVPLTELARRADAGEIADMKTMLLVETLRRRRPTLFD